MFRRVEAYPDTVPILEWRSLAVAAGVAVSTGIFSTADRAQRDSVFFNAGGLPWRRVYNVPTGLYLLDVATFSAGIHAIEVYGYWHIAATTLGPARLLSTSAIGAGAVGQLSGFRVVTPYVEVQLRNTGAGPFDLDMSVMLRTR